MLANILAPFMFLAGAGFVASVVAHVASIAGIELPGGRNWFVLHAGIFAVWIPAILVMNRFRGRVSKKDIWKTAFAGSPVWMLTALKVIFGYSFVSFFLFVVNAPSHSKQSPVSLPAEIRAFSGHWMIFYSVAFATLYSARERPDLLVEKRCSSNHVVSSTAEYCETCGERVRHGGSVI